MNLWDAKLLRPGWEIWRYPDDGDMPISRLKIAFDGKVVHTFVFDHACPKDLVMKDLYDALKHHGALKARYT